MSTPKLLPCPFCGGEAEVERYGNSRHSTIYRCTDCGCSLETGEEWGHGADWNTRARAEGSASPPPPAEGVGKEEHGSSCTDLSCAQTHTLAASPAGLETLKEAFERDHELAQIPALIMSNIEELPGWKDSAALVTAHCHAYVLHHDLPDALSLAAAHPREGDVGKLVGALKACRSKFEDYALQHYRKRTDEGDAKAFTNQQMATLCDEALAAAEAASPVLLEGDLAGVSSASVPASSHGCICPPGAELHCQGALCPRRGIGHATASLSASVPAGLRPTNEPSAAGGEG